MNKIWAMLSVLLIGWTSVAYAADDSESMSGRVSRVLSARSVSFSGLLGVVAGSDDLDSGLFAGVQAAAPVAEGFQVGAAYRHGFTQPENLQVLTGQVLYNLAAHLPVPGLVVGYELGAGHLGSWSFAHGPKLGAGVPVGDHLSAGAELALLFLSPEEETVTSWWPAAFVRYHF